MSSSCDPPRVSQMTSMSAQQSPSASERKIAYEDDIVASSQLILAYLDNEKQSRLLQPYTSGEQPTHMRDLQSHGSVNPIDKNLGANQQQFLWPSTETGNTESDVGNRYQIPAVIGNGHSQLSNLQENAVSSSQSWNGAPYAGPGTFLHDQQPQPHTTQQGCNYPVARQSLPQMYRSAFSPPSGHRQSNSPVTTLSTPMYSSIDLSKPPKRHRRRKSILNLQFHCEVPGCERKYASKLSRKQHYLLKHPSEKFDTK
ncbi:hypothetical protein SARC_04382 [Sphaeroforma arctica JP610]|uniref:C2H2-type domain-containing protein n=1 Tax=Sphaeroforma arctica JP610 TaxID=667725 RepID=A0A0L0G3C2_9EUKA|nr:hypothetical protein SARC_04382 [Sphaeroforma arctica JP610]KNC83374.1 hypothetical protein SARC_04382 [Sphaeroforma arctica JP610]|eukprot:XP_014157276.1 hypothetical protein SARC_04382 [Sphaeroforma arctica JP610]